MIVGCPKEIKPQEYRVGLTPNAVKEISLHNHSVLIERNAGIGSGFSNEDYINSGAKIIDGPEELFIKSGELLFWRVLSKNCENLFWAWPKFKSA